MFVCLFVCFGTEHVIYHHKDIFYNIAFCFVQNYELFSCLVTRE